MDELIHKGHRQRMRRKFTEFGSRVFDTYELLEMLLYNTVPQKDTNPISKRLLMRFGSLDGVLSADISELTKVDGVGQKSAEMIKSVGEAIKICLSEGKNDAYDERFDNYDALGEYIVNYFGGREDYLSVLLTFDNNMNLLGIDDLYDLDYSSGGIKPKPFIDAAVKRSASVAIVAHNHPFGPLCPTEGDRETNTVIQNALYNIGILLLEHYVICGTRYLGFMNHMNSVFTQRPMVGKFFESKRCSRYG